VDAGTEGRPRGARPAGADDDTEGIGVTSINLAAGALATGDLRTAVDHLEVGYARLVELGFREQRGYANGVTADLALVVGRLEDAGTLLGAFAEQFRIVGSPPQAEEGERYERDPSRPV
jgi:hypothetical protein